MSVERGPDDPDGWVVVSGGQGVQVGNDNTQVNYFGTSASGVDLGFRVPLTGRTYLHDPPAPVPDYVERGQWLKRVLSFLGGPGGYLVVEGPAGVGKTAFLAHLARSRGYPCAFIASELDDPRIAIVDLCDRLAERWKLPHRLTLHLRRAWEAAGGDMNQRLGAAVQVLLGEAAARGRGQVVLVIDGVTADDRHVNQILPRRLPSGVYIIIGQRSGGRASDGFEPRSVLTIKPAEHATGELRRWVTETVRRDPYPEVLRRAGIAAEEFTDALTRKAAGIWIYARYVLSDVGRGTLDPSKIAAIPTDLWRYFANYFRHWRERHPDTWASHDLPALATLVAAREDLPVTRLASLLPRTNEMELEIEWLHRLLGQSWISFLSHSPQTDGYRCYHQSLRDFVAGDMATTDLTALDRELQAGLQRALVRANRRLAEHYRELLDGGSSDTPERRSALRAFAAEHSTAVGDLNALDALLVRESRPVNRFGQRQQSCNNAYRDCERDGDIGGYLEIARAALALAHQLNSTGSISSAQTIRHALIGSSLTSMAANLPTELLRAVLTHQLWAPREVLRHIEAVPETHQRAHQLAEVLPDLTGSAFTDGAELLAEIAAAESTERFASESIEKFLSLLGRRLPELPGELINRLLAGLRTEALERLCPVLCRWMPSERLPLLIQHVLAVRYWDANCAAIVRACGEASPSICEAFVREIADSEFPEHRKALATAPLITLLEPKLRQIELATRVATRLSRCHVEYLRGRQLFDLHGEDVAIAQGYLAPVLPGLLSGEDDPLPAEPSPRHWFRWPRPREDETPGPAIREDVLKNPELLARAHCIAASITLSDDQRADHARHAYDAIMAIQNSYTQGELLVKLCDIAGDHLDAPACLNQVLHIHRDIKWVLLGRLLPWLPDDDCASVLDWATSDERPHLQVIKVLLPRLSQTQIESLLLRTWPGDNTHHILERQELLLTAADGAVIQRYLDANLPPADSKIDWAATERLKAVCAAPQASREQVQRCVQRLVEGYDPHSPYHWEVLAAGLPRLSPQRVAEIADKVGLLEDSAFHGRRRILIAIAETLPATKLLAVVAAARAEGKGDRQAIIGSIALRLPRELLDEAVDAARRIGEDSWWSDTISSIIPYATAEIQRQVAALTWPFRPDTPDGRSSAFEAASSRLPTARILDMLDALQQEIAAGEAGERQTFQASRVLLAALQSQSAEVAAVCAQLAADHGLLADSTIVSAILDCAEHDTRQQVVELVWEGAHHPEGKLALGRLEPLTAILGFISAERVLAVAEMVSSMAESLEQVRLFLALADAWPEDHIHTIEMLVPPAKAAADSGDRYCRALRAVASRCSGELRQELFDEILGRLGQRAAGYYGEDIPDEVVREASPNAASRLRTTLFERLKEGERVPDHLLAMLAAKLPVTEALAAVRDTLDSSTAPVHEDARRLVAGLVDRADERTIQDLLELITGVEDQPSRGELLAALAPALSPNQVHRALSSLEEIPPSSPRSLPGQNAPALAVVTARHALAVRLNPAERAPIIDAILSAVANNPPERPDILPFMDPFPYGAPTAPEWAADLIPRLLPDASPNGRELALMVARKHHDEAAATVFLAVAANSATSEARATALDNAVDRIGRIRQDETKARLLGAAARTCDGAEANHLFAEALTAAEACTSFGNEQCTVLVDLAHDAPPGARADVLARAIMSYDSRWSIGDPAADIITALGELSGPACDHVAASVAYGCRDKPRSELLLRLAIVCGGASRSLGPDWADQVVLSLTQVGSWWP